MFGSIPEEKQGEVLGAKDFKKDSQNRTFCQEVEIILTTITSRRDYADTWVPIFRCALSSRKMEQPETDSLSLPTRRDNIPCYCKFDTEALSETFFSYNDRIQRRLPRKVRVQ